MRPIAYRVVVYKDGGQWAAHVYKGKKTWWEGFLCDENDPPEVVVATALCLATVDTNLGDKLAERGIVVVTK